jgi:hypothetical protein
MSEHKENSTQPPKNKRFSRSDKLPALHFYPGDWKKDLGVQALELVDRAVWFELLLLMHESEERGVLTLNGQPMTHDQLARIIGLDKQILTNALTKIISHGVASVREDGAIFCRRMVRDEDIRQKRIKAGLSGGNPNLLKQNASKTRANVKQNPEVESEDEDVNENEDNRESSQQRSANTEIIEIPEGSGFLESKALSALDRWGEYIQKTYKKPWGQMQADALMMRYHGRIADFIRDINGSMAAGWRTINDCSNLEARPNAPNKKQRETSFEQNLRILRES